MILKIFKIQSKDGVSALQEKFEYARDPDKTFMSDADLVNMKIAPLDQPLIRDLSYDPQLDEAKGFFVSGYRCSPNRFLEEVAFSHMILGETPAGVVAYHTVQSVDEGFDTSAEDVHTCGCELVARIGVSKAIICTHAHPIIDENGEIHGACLHNHILSDAYIDPAMIDPKHPNVHKIHMDNEFREQLHIWNDEISIAHGLPIVRDPDMGRRQSWFEKELKKRGNSWKASFCATIECVRDESSGWEDFIDRLAQKGLSFVDNTFQTYTDGVHRVRGKTLGRDYTKEGLEAYWAHRVSHIPAIPDPFLWEVYQKHPAYTVGIPVGTRHKQLVQLPLGRSGISDEALSSYFDEYALYGVYDERLQLMYQVSGAQVLYHYALLDEDMLRNNQAAAEMEQHIKAEEERLRRAKKEAKSEYYSNPRFCSSKTGQPYRIQFYDPCGDRVSMLEAILRLAIVVLWQEDGLWLPSTIPPNQEHDVCYATPDWKTQRILDAIAIAREEDVHSLKDLDLKIKAAQPAYLRAKAMLKGHLYKQKKLQPIYDAAMTFKNSDRLVKKLADMPEGPEKRHICAAHQAELDAYANAKELLETKGMLSYDKISRLQAQMDEIQENIDSWSDKYEKKLRHYKRLRQLEYQLRLAQTQQYCYGPEYPGPEKAAEMRAEKERQAKKRWWRRHELER